MSLGFDDAVTNAFTIIGFFNSRQMGAHNVRSSFQSGNNQDGPELTLRADIVAKVPNCPAIIL